jgi:tRNA pseudouridine32 synthase/23S rRNA pseudouridine746 synthase
MSYSSARFETHITVDDSQMTAVDLLAAETELSKQTIKKIMLKGAVWLTIGKKTQRIRRAKRSLKPG